MPRVDVFPDDGEPLSFEGDLVFSDLGQEAVDRFARRYALQLYRRTDAQAGQYVAVWSYLTDHERERQTQWVVANRASPLAFSSALSAWARTHNPRPFLLGFPAGEQFEPRAKRVAERLSAQIRYMVQPALQFIADQHLGKA